MRSRSRGNDNSEQGTETPASIEKQEEVGRQGFVGRTLHWIDSKVYVYNVTFGLYMLDWWERLLFNALVLLLLWFVAYSGSDFVVHCYEELLKALRDWPATARRSSIGINGDRYGLAGGVCLVEVEWAIFLCSPVLKGLS
ncbi:hypothetical protein R1sor_022847 [Riccia sorocarpa]|uniref:Uncharacterized protein n=1 Tax=Riccia sorocarpa TaxID=122646 RepID=A0ABD3GMT3_9MARC